MFGGHFYGSAGDDDVYSQDGGIYIDGRGDDRVSDAFVAGEFYGGLVNDALYQQWGGRFYGSRGRDSVDNLIGGLFDAGRGVDDVKS